MTLCFSSGNSTRYRCNLPLGGLEDIAPLISLGASPALSCRTEMSHTASFVQDPNEANDLQPWVEFILAIQPTNSAFEVP